MSSTEDSTESSSKEPCSKKIKRVRLRGKKTFQEG
jgi:hypothetical protein